MKLDHPLNLKLLPSTLEGIWKSLGFFRQRRAHSSCTIDDIRDSKSLFPAVNSHHLIEHAQFKGLDSQAPDDVPVSGGRRCSSHIGDVQHMNLVDLECAHTALSHFGLCRRTSRSEMCRRRGICMRSYSKVQVFPD